MNFDCMCMIDGAKNGKLCFVVTGMALLAAFLAVNGSEEIFIRIQLDNH